MSTATPLDYADRCERYARQAGWAYDEHRISIDKLTPRQRKRALKKERHAGHNRHGTPRRAEAIERRRGYRRMAEAGKGVLARIMAEHRERPEAPF